MKSRSKKPRLKESDIQRATVWHVVKNYKDVSIVSTSNEYLRAKADAAIELGIPDLRLECLSHGWTYILYLELKTRTGKLEKSQIEWNEHFDCYRRSNNCERALAHSFPEAKKHIDNWYLKLHTKKTNQKGDSNDTE